MRILREEGLESVTMRRVAGELDTGAASLYVYVKGRDELRAAMIDRLARLVELEDPDPLRWREQVHQLLLEWLHAMEAHPGIATLFVGNPPTTEGMLVGAEYLLSLLRAAGISARDAAWGMDILFLIVSASAVETDVRRVRSESDEDLVARLTSEFAALSPVRFPNIRNMLSDMTDGDRDDHFIFSIDVFLDGLVARSAR